MADFLKIFLCICAVASAFIFGRGYGERTYRESQEYKDFAKAKEELNYAKNELENAKAKLQNIIDSAANKKTDELLGQIFQVFLADLGLQIQNREMILKQAQATPAEAPAKLAQPKIPETKTPEQKPPAASAWNKLNFNKFKSHEWMLENSTGGPGALRELERLKLKNLNQAAGDLSYLKEECESFLGSYKGQIKDTLQGRLGSLSFELRSGNLTGTAEYFGTINWFNEANSTSLTEKIGNNCGKKITGLSGRIFSLSQDRFVQVYKLSNIEKLAGNLYEVLPHGTTHYMGAFVLGRTDKF